MIASLLASHSETVSVSTASLPHLYLLSGNACSVSAPLGFFDPLGFASKASAETVAKYRESEVSITSAIGP